jgi:hypothetical protein
MSESLAITARQRAEAIVGEHGYPVRAPRQSIAEIVTRHAYQVHHRSIERWPLPTRRINGKTHLETIDALAYALEGVDAAPLVMGGRGAATRS